MTKGRSKLAGDRPEAVGFISGPEFVEHYTGLGFPESPRRLAAIWERLQKDFLWDRLVHIDPRPASVEELLTVHDREYVELVRREVELGRAMLSTGDTHICPRSYDVALLAAGAGLSAVDAVCAGRVRSAFCAVRPPGHHAGPRRGMGFCIFNSAAVAARYAQRACGVARVLIADWDVHHGNGTQEAFYDDPSVFYFSTHQLGLYPMPLTGMGDPRETGSGAGEGTTLNCPLQPGAGDAEIIAAFTDRLVPAMSDFAPELVIISAGFDSHRADPLALMGVTDEGFAALTEIVMEIADASAGGRIVSFLEGGYDLSALASAAAAHVTALMH